MVSEVGEEGMRSAGYHQVCSMNPEASNYDMQLIRKKHGRSYNSDLLLPPPTYLIEQTRYYILTFAATKASVF